MTEATKRPWQLEQRPHLRGNEFMIHGADEPSGRTIVYHHELNAPCSVLSKVNADLFIKCVNMHDGLVAALARYGQHRASCTIYGHHGQLCNCGWRKERAKLESALAQAAEAVT